MANILAKIDIPIEDEIGIIRYLIDEIEEERDYNYRYELAYKEARRKAEKEGGYYREYMDNRTFYREPRQSVIKDNIKTIRRLMLKIGR